MTYGVGGLIQASDLNNLVSTGTPNLNNIWADGSGNSGYGQPALATVAVGEEVTAAKWAALINKTALAAAHQGSTITSVPAPSTGDLIEHISAIPTNLSTINTRRLNAAHQGSTTATTATNGTPWSNTLTFTFHVAFASDDAARYYFNSGGQFLFNFSHPAVSGGSINNAINRICSEAGTLCYSSPTSGTVSLSGTSFNGVTKIGGLNPGATAININNGFYSVYPTGTNILLTQYSDYTYYTEYSTTKLVVGASYNGSGTLTFYCYFNDLGVGASVTAGTTATLTKRPPSTTYLSNSWGTPTISYTIART